MGVCCGHIDKALISNGSRHYQATESFGYIIIEMAGQARRLNVINENNNILRFSFSLFSLKRFSR